jgi:hypothetical protein
MDGMTNDVVLLNWDPGSGGQWISYLPYTVNYHHLQVVSVNNTADTLPFLQALEIDINGTTTQDIGCDWLYENAPPWYAPLWTNTGGTLAPTATADPAITLVSVPNFISTIAGTQQGLHLTSTIYNEYDGGGVEIVNSNAGIETFCGVNSDGGGAGVSDFVELYSKTTANSAGTRLYVHRDGLGVMIANTRTITTIGGCDFSLTADGLSLGSSSTSYTMKLNGIPIATSTINLGQITSFNFADLASLVPSGGVGFGWANGGNGGWSDVANYWVSNFGVGGSLTVVGISNTSGTAFGARGSSGTPIWRTTAIPPVVVVALGPNLTLDAGPLSVTLGVGDGMIATGYGSAGITGGCGEDAMYIIMRVSASTSTFYATAFVPSNAHVYTTSWTIATPTEWVMNGSSGSNTITHRTDIQEFDASMIGTFCETTGQISNVYGEDYTPTLDRATDAIVKVKQSNVLNSAVLGIIVDSEHFASHGDCLCIVVEGEYEIGQLLVPDSSGVCRVATEQEALWSVVHRVPLPKITAIFEGEEFVACFLQ